MSVALPSIAGVLPTLATLAAPAGAVPTPGSDGEEFRAARASPRGEKSRSMCQMSGGHRGWVVGHFTSPFLGGGGELGHHFVVVVVVVAL